tara:strand:+ start:217 stop:471 length:255 start_codon:yes stop_codon:yes gene_type:complete
MSDKTFILSEESALSWTKLASGTPMEDHYITENLALTKEAEGCWSKLAEVLAKWKPFSPERHSRYLKMIGRGNVDNIPKTLLGQ